MVQKVKEGAREPSGITWPPTRMKTMSFRSDQSRALGAAECASIAALMLTTEALITELPERKTKPPQDLRAAMRMSSKRESTRPNQGLMCLDKSPSAYWYE